MLKLIRINKKAVISIIIAFIYLAITTIYIVSRTAFTAIENQPIHWYEVQSDKKPVACMISIEDVDDKRVIMVLFKTNLASATGLKVINRGVGTVGAMHEANNYCGGTAKDDTTFILPINTLAASQKIAVSVLDIFYLTISALFYWLAWKFHFRKKYFNRKQ